MPDKWEYPWYAAWDLAFHCIPLALVDPHFAKGQLDIILREWYQHPNGQIPAYEWNFGDVNPPVIGWAAWRIYKIEQKQSGKGDRDFLETVFHKLLISFTWWVNRKDSEGKNIFQGGFLGLDNIGVFDRSAPLPNGGHLEQSDGTSWMGMFCLNMMRMALELARENPVYENIATKFFEHFLGIAGAMNNLGGKGIGLWDEPDEFYYDVLHMPDGRYLPLRVRSLVGLMPLLAVETIEPELLDAMPGFKGRLEWYLADRPDLASLISRWYDPGAGERRLISLTRGHRMKCLLRRMLHPDEFLSDYGVRSLSKYHADSSVRASAGRRLGAGGELRAGRIANEYLRRQFKLARPGLAADQLSPDRVAPKISPLLRRRFQGGMPDRLGPLPDPERDCERVIESADPALAAGRQRLASFRPGVRRFAECRARSGSVFVPRIFPRRHRRGIGRQPTRPAGPASSRN